MPLSLRWLFARPPSLRRQLLAWLLLPLMVLLAINAYSSNRVAEAVANMAFDRLLLASADAIAEDVSVKDGLLMVDLPYAALELLESNIQERIFYRVIGPQGETLTGYEDLPPPARPVPEPGSMLYSTRYHGDTVYLVALNKQIYGSGSSMPVQVIVAETGEARDALSRQIWLEGLWRQSLIIAAAVVLVGWGLYRGLRPLARLSASIANRSPSDLNEIAAQDVQVEVQSLVQALNHHMSRIQKLLESRQRFIADASHQMRTPLAEMRTQIEVCQRQGDAALAQATLCDVHEDIGRLSRLVAQLMALARSEPSALASQQMESQELNGLVATVAADFVPAARRKSIMLNFDAAPSAMTVRGHGPLIYELVANLLDNAIAYSPPGSSVTVSVHDASCERIAEAGSSSTSARSAAVVPVLEVEDQGPGIPQAEHAKVLTRFYRPSGSAGSGTGLGLAIVHDICVAHGAQLTLLAGTDGRGLRVRITFRASGA
ncbi:sensor histidine kinase [Roseateles koreensis]|uniref:histidine kinase n=1 Tax=Roseateles koreensis TaxID=2987526 RepID=A0ABT5KQZ7_9BURK|nr:sensor histidine kinase [Roseateles koreensis]MDC8785342.1 sensor histidine kinase N-terminal domain-containing protein [Roseateles koreensis]